MQIFVMAVTFANLVLGPYNVVSKSLKVTCMRDIHEASVLLEMDGTTFSAIRRLSCILPLS
jgi:hypothetical protein